MAQITIDSSKIPNVKMAACKELDNKPNEWVCGLKMNDGTEKTINLVAPRDKLLAELEKAAEKL